MALVMLSNTHVSPLSQTIRHGTPVLVMKGTGRVADLISVLSCVCQDNKSDPEGLHFVSAPQLRNQDIDPRMLGRFVVAKRIAQEIQGGTVGTGSQTFQLSDRWKELFVHFLFKDREDMAKNENQLCDLAKELTYVMKNIGRLFIHNIKHAARADGGVPGGGGGATLIDAVAQCVYVEMRRKGRASTCLRLWRRYSDTKPKTSLKEEAEGTEYEIVQKIEKVREMIERSFRKNELLLFIQVISK